MKGVPAGDLRFGLLARGFNKRGVDRSHLRRLFERGRRLGLGGVIRQRHGFDSDRQNRNLNGFRLGNRWD